MPLRYNSLPLPGREGGEADGRPEVWGFNALVGSGSWGGPEEMHRMKRLYMEVR